MMEEPNQHHHAMKPLPSSFFSFYYFPHCAHCSAQKHFTIACPPSRDQIFLSNLNLFTSIFPNPEIPDLGYSC
ncbi:hypothetical protein VNO80_27406 [Phaseolus coccineus]|uniref:Uncharacterized protein n=1 Tax=Phaseolus coccineus TaxID=3886 RepID=A0AAN9LGC2_PHACN